MSVILSMILPATSNVSSWEIVILAFVSPAARCPDFSSCRHSKSSSLTSSSHGTQDGKLSRLSVWIEQVASMTFMPLP
ncbi:hypothetical protein BDZ45DRAFT_402335 [Acephala macrosclerotiorum]|nr:hypothetical protein BDZ45DRAFT_402335 [Acephala macrosclerotiorum]